jgi:hypothetical protein
MKKILASLAAMAIAISACVFTVSAEPAEGDPFEVIIHYSNTQDGVDMSLLGTPVVVVNAIVKKAILPDDPSLGYVDEFGWSQFEGFTGEDDFGKIFAYTAGYKVGDVHEIQIKQDWVDVSLFKFDVAESYADGKIELWVTATEGTEASISATDPNAPAPAAEAPAAGDTAAAPAADKGGADTGIADVGVFAGAVVVLAGATLLISKKRK